MLRSESPREPPGPAVIAQPNTSAAPLYRCMWSRLQRGAELCELRSMALARPRTVAPGECRGSVRRATDWPTAYVVALSISHVADAGGDDAVAVRPQFPRRVSCRRLSESLRGHVQVGPGLPACPRH